MMLHRNAFQTTSRGDGSRSSTTHDPNKNRISKENKDATYFYFSKNNNYYYDSNDDKSVKSVHDKYDCINNVFTSSSSFTLLKSFDTLSNKKAAFQSAVSSSSSPVLLACSVSSVRKEHEDLFTWRKLCQDRKGWVDHLHPDKFIMNVRLALRLIVFFRDK